ncbi:MarR family winged helix-turn-helix transcriptional regulator [Nitrospirillum viridazoti]|uniref:MarR family winged helix-turn-helix transcriptional regulator n=1 Tax=Nitrospirillum viridazoti TaxID=3144925 RepID=UPI0011AD9736|nr:MarR family winged helix-turn-helix transcriptional regulator [Nitrospirillum amazonense]TWB34126.1 MarR family transcriptional regulator [Nitrospirillum amazonense]
MDEPAPTAAVPIAAAPIASAPTATASNEGPSDRWGWDYCTNTAVRRAARRLGQLYGDVTAPAGLMPTQHTLLTHLKLAAAASDPAAGTLQNLAAAMVMDLSALGHTLKPLIRDGYVELVPDAKDRRVKRARLTAAGEAKQAEGLALWHVAQSRFDALFGAEESAALRRALAIVASEEFAAAFKKKE